jgi:hypothetical protein
VSCRLRVPGGRRAGLVAIIAVCLAYASVAQGGGENELAHFSLVRALSHATPAVDPYHEETIDLSWYRGHYYSTKAPGLALLAVGPYFLLDHAGVLDLASRVTGATRDSVALYLLGLVGAVLPTGLILLLLRNLGDRFEPGFGAVTAVTAGLCTLLFPFATLLFDHALAAALGLAAFAVLWHARGRPFAVAAAGLLAGLAVTSEYPFMLVAVALGLYTLAGAGHRVRRVVAYAGGVAIGLFPLLLYDWWAFGSPSHLSYEDAILRPGVTGHDLLGANEQGLFGVSTPQRGVALELLFHDIGLITVTPVVVAGAVGLVFLWRKGLHGEAALAAALAAAYLIYNSGYVVPFGGGTPGPRFLLPMLPFLALGFASAYRAYPWATLALALPSGLVMLGVTATGPIHATTWAWIDRVADTSFTGSGIWPKLPLAAFVLTAVLFCAWATPITRPGLRQAIGALLTLGAYLGLALTGPGLVGTNPRLLLAIVAACLALATLWHTGFRPHGRTRPAPTRH